MPSTTLRQTVLANARHVVVKLGTQLLARPNKQRGLDLPFFDQIADQIVALRKRGMRVTLVSSGAVGCGMVELGLNRRPADVAEQQAVAAVGQRRLMDHWAGAFARHQLHVAQLLLTRGDFDDRVRFLNIRNCVARLQEWDTIPILNENDTVATDELRFGDNDMLAALTTNALRAEALVILSVVDGLLDAKGQRVDLVDDLVEAGGLTRKEKSGLGTGGMGSKLDAMRIVTEAGEVAVIAHGRAEKVLERLFDPQQSAGLGTIFVPRPRKLDSRRRWIGLTKRPAGVLTLDDGAVTALCQRGKSLLATGITAVDGDFERGEVVLLRDAVGAELARGLCNYGAVELALILGKRSTQFEKILGRPAYAEVVHRDNLVLLTH